jgi:hypothetical protein
VAIVVIPLAARQVPLLPLMVIGVPAVALLPVLFYRHSKALWMCFDFMVHPVGLL